MILCIAIFYDGSIVLPSLVPTYTAFTANERPLVDFFSSPGNSQNLAIAGSLVNFVVLTAVASGEAFEIVLVLVCSCSCSCSCSRSCSCSCSC